MLTVGLGKESAIKSLTFRLKKYFVKAITYWDIQNQLCIVIVGCMKKNHGAVKILWR